MQINSSKIEDCAAFGHIKPSHSALFSACAAVFVLMWVPAAGAANTSLNFAGDIELDTTYSKLDSAKDASFYQGGRVQLSVMGEHKTGDHFVRAKASLLASKNGNAYTDDMFFQFGSDVWDIKLGRYEGINLFPEGRDTLVDHVDGDLNYRANKGRGRVGGGDGQISFNYYLGSAMSFTLDTVYGDSTLGGPGTEALSVIRPSATYRADAFSVTLGAESISANDGGIDQTGLALTSSIKLAEATLNLNVAALADDVSNADTTTLGVSFVSTKLGGGVIHTEVDDGANKPSQSTAYGTYTTRFFDIDRALVTYALSYSTLDNGVDDDSRTSGRVRINYLF